MVSYLSDMCPEPIFRNSKSMADFHADFRNEVMAPLLSVAAFAFVLFQHYSVAMFARHVMILADPSNATDAGTASTRAAAEIEAATTPATAATTTAISSYLSAELPTPSVSPYVVLCASVEGLPQDKMDRFKEKILALDTLNENQKSRLLETMNYELKKLQPPKSDKDLAAEKIQRIGRGKVARSQNDAGPAGETTEEVFINFCKTYRQTMMTNTIWAKFCKDARLLDKDKFPKPAVDMVWTTVARTEKKVTYTGFVELLKGVAVKKGVEYSVIEAHVLENAKVSNSGTKGASRFHDDKSTYTGTHIGK